MATQKTSDAIARIYKRLSIAQELIYERQFELENSKGNPNPVDKVIYQSLSNELDCISESIIEIEKEWLNS